MAHGVTGGTRARWSYLKYLRPGYGSPKHYLHAVDNPRPDTDALKLGRLTHCMIYEPNEAAKRYVLMPRFHGGMKDETAIEKGYDGGKQAKAAWEAKHAGAEIIDSDTYAQAVGMRDALLRDPVSSPLVRGGKAEQRIEWTDVETGIECQGTVDHVNGRLSDLKTTRNVAPRRFIADAARYGYHAQLAFYLDGLRANGIEPEGAPCLIAVESSAPHDVLVLELSKTDIEAGRRVYRECLDILDRCRRTGRWPGVSDGAPMAMELPEWAAPKPELTLGGVALDI